MKLNLLPSLALLLLISKASHAADKITLRQNWQTGKIYTMENQTQMSMTMAGLGPKSGANDTTMTQTMTISVKPDGDAGNKAAEVKFTAIKADLAMMGQKMSYDSADTAKSPPFLQQSFGALLNKSFTLVYDKENKYVETRGMEALTQGSPLGGAKAMNGEQMSSMMRKSFDMSLPKEPVAPGDTWNFEEKLEMGPMGSMTIKVTGKFDSVVEREGHKHAKLMLSGTFSSPGADDEKGGMVKFGEGSTFSGETYFDLVENVTDYAETHSDLKMSAAGQEIPVKQNNVNKLISIKPL
jgi:Family of unknown function (DUF6263)